MWGCVTGSPQDIVIFPLCALRYSPAMPAKEPAQNPAEITVIAFNEAITAADLDALAGLLTDDHVFTDSAGTEIAGKPAVCDAWSGFFAAFPGYRNIFDSIATDGDTVIATGESRADDPRLSGPALWRARVTGGQLASWEVFDDTANIRAQLGLPDR